ncbi:Prokaryotic diacylglycerol kinase [Planctomycetes bacterium CA13]|uniref:Prokaryotic diacylglycerol kinase n=1 Tax=Novipirellula herctigrandis TaxID=2527986 RepID=A0A5C5Z3K2_9BACT|nr:Prokaryotic diacylglycerol kinase [Planctomycetes bacterium CA13]
MNGRSSWAHKFAVAFRGLGISICDQSSFWVHLPIAVAVLIIALFLHLETWRWAMLVCMITIVLSAELMNTAIERLCKRLHPEHDEVIGNVLDTAAAAVLVAGLGAAVVGLIVIGDAIL